MKDSGSKNILKMTRSFNNMLTTIENIADAGSYETDLITGKWKGSENFIELFGLPKKQEYTVEEFQALVHPDDFEDVMSYFAHCLEEKKDFNYEYRCIKSNGEVIYISSRSHVYYSDEGTPLKVVGLKQDITSREKQKLQPSHGDKLHQKKYQVLGMVAHDLRTPISQIFGIVSLLEDEADENQVELLEMAKDACQAANHIISDLIEISENEISQPVLNKVRTDINELLNQCIRRFKCQLNDKNLRVRTSFAADATGLVDKRKFIRVLDNLISNAIKFSPDHKTIQLITEKRGDNVYIHIEDEGIGIKKEYLPILFDKFPKTFRRPGTKGERSNGLGLYIVKQIIDMLGGTISVESEVNKGTVFTIELEQSKNTSVD